MLFGLRIEDKVVNEQVNQDNAIYKENLGVGLFEELTRGQGIYLRYLKQYYTNLVLTGDSTEKEKLIKTRCYIMILFGQFLFLKTTVNNVNIMYLPWLRDITTIGTYT